MCTSALPNRLPAHPCPVQLSRRRTAASAPRNPSPSAPPPASPSALCSMAHHLRSQRRSVDSAAAELESTAAEVDPAVADIKSAAAEVESRGGGAPISEGGGPRCFNRRRRSLNRRRFGGRREHASWRATLPAQDSPSAPLRVARPPLCSWLGVSAAQVGRLLDWIRIFHVSEFCFIYLFADTPWIRVHRVSDAYPYRICIRYGIRPLPGVSG